MRLTVTSGILIVFLVLHFQLCHAQSSWTWPEGKKSAIVLTYDDALLSQLNIAIPQLDSVGYMGTFFLSGNLKEDEMLRWEAASRHGHELGNHTLYHPCAKATLNGKPRYITENYSVDDMLREIGMMNKLLFGIDHNKKRSYAYPCAETVVGGKDYADSLHKSGLSRYARVGGNDDAIITDFKALDLFRVPSWGFADNPDGNRLIAFVKRAIEKNGLGIFMFHGVGGDYLDVSAAAHRQLLEYLKQHNNDVWVTTFSEALSYIEKQNKAR